MRQDTPSLFNPDDDGGLSGFVLAVHGDTEHAVELRSFPNAAGSGAPVSHFGRDLADMELQLKRLDKPGRGMFMGIASRRTGRGKGDRANVMELAANWTDIDCSKLGLDKAAVTAVLKGAMLPPSLIVDSGGGLHGYWCHKEPSVVAPESEGALEVEERAVSANRQLCGVFAGDPKATDVSRVLRLPGSHNTKPEVVEQNGGVPPLVKVIWPENIDDPAVLAGLRRYDLEELEEWLEVQCPLIQAEAPGLEDLEPAPKPADNPYAAYAKRFGSGQATDVEDLLANMSFQHAGEYSIHQVQLRVSASLLMRGWDVDAIADTLVSRTREVAERDAGRKARTWNWKREERNIRKMCKDWMAKPQYQEYAAERAEAEERLRAYQESEPAAGREQASAGATAEDTATMGATGTDDTVINAADKFAAKRQRDRQAKGRGASGAADSKDLVLPALADSVIDTWQASQGKLAAVDGVLYTYGAGVWTRFDEKLTARLRAMIQQALVASQVEPTPQKKNAVLEFVRHAHRIRRVGVQWDAVPLIVGLNGCLVPDTGEIIGHSPDHYATRKVEVTFDPAARCPHWLRFLDDVFGCFEPEGAEQRIWTVQEWFGSMLSTRLGRDLRKVCWWWGDKRTGKSRFTAVARMLMGETAICALHPPDLEDKFGMQALLGARAWIADDVLDDDAFVPGGKFKCIATGEQVAVRQMNKPSITTSFDLPIAFSANDRPRFKDSTDACYDRIIPIRLMRQFPAGTARSERVMDAEFRAELAGIYVWAMEGLKRLKERGHFEQHDWLLDGQKEFREGNTMIEDFIHDCVAWDPAYRTEINDLYCAMNGYARALYGDSPHSYSGKTILKVLRNKFPKLPQKSKPSNSRYWFEGLRLNPEGHDHGLEERKRRGQEEKWLGTKIRPNAAANEAERAEPYQGRKTRF